MRKWLPYPAKNSTDRVLEELGNRFLKALCVTLLGLWVDIASDPQGRATIQLETRHRKNAKELIECEACVDFVWESNR